MREGPFRRQDFSTSIVDVGRPVARRRARPQSAASPIAWLRAEGYGWTAEVRFAPSTSRDPTGPSSTRWCRGPSRWPIRSISSSSPTQKLDECRRRVQNETSATAAASSTPSIGAAGFSPRPTSDSTRRAVQSSSGCCEAGDPKGEVATAWHAKEAVRHLYGTSRHAPPPVPHPALKDLTGRRATPSRCVASAARFGAGGSRSRLATSHVSNGPTEATNNMIKRVKRAAFGFRSFANYRVRALLYAGKPDWHCSQRSLPAEIRRAR